jgi:hypothetical protein
MARLIRTLPPNIDFAGSTACTRTTTLPNSDGKNLCNEDRSATDHKEYLGL